jgi:hypothetical protein
VDEVIVERRARHRGVVREALEGPRHLRLLVKERQHAADPGAAHARQPPRLAGRQRVDVTTQDLDEEHLAHALQDGLPARPPLVRLDDRRPQER